MILLDTNIVVAYLNGHAGIAQRMAAHHSEIALPSLVAAELYYGACASARADENLGKLEQLCNLVPIVSFDLSAARRFGTLKADLRRRGKPTGETDTWIAAVALAQSATLVTHNARDFEHIPGLRLGDWLSESP
ncbi:MAG: type II toxin-antitoxin system VapC family toxin [Nitrospiraceae bacterium]